MVHQGQRRRRQGDFTTVLAKIVPQVKAAASGVSDEAIVNGLTTAFCKVGRDDPQYGNASWPTVLGSFANVAYSQVRHPEKHASARPDAPPAADTGQPVRN